MYLLKLFHDNLSPKSEALLQAQHSIIYVFKGSVTVNWQCDAEDAAILC